MPDSRSNLCKRALRSVHNCDRLHLAGDAPRCALLVAQANEIEDSLVMPTIRIHFCKPVAKVDSARPQRHRTPFLLSQDE